MSGYLDNGPELFWKNLLDTSVDWELFINQDGKIIFTSPNCIEFTGSSAEEILADNSLIWKCIDKHHQKKVKQYHQQRIKNTKDLLTLEFKIIMPDGKGKWVSSYSKPAFSTNGTLLGFRVSNRDITEINKRQVYIEKLNEQQNVLVSVTQVAASNDPFEIRIQTILGIIGKYTGVSRVYIFEDNDDGTTTSNTFEWCKEGILCQQDQLQDFEYAWIPSWDKILSKEQIIMVPDIRKLPVDVFNILNPQGIKAVLILPLHLYNRRIGFIGFDECTENKKWENDEINLLKTVSNTITNALYRKKYEKELEKVGMKLRKLLDEKTVALDRSENYYKALIEIQPDLICRWLPDTTLTFVNESYCLFFGVTESEIIGKKRIDFLDDESRSLILPLIQNIHKTGKPSIYEHVSKNFQGERRWHQWIDIPIKNSDGSIIELQSSGRDITEKIRHEDQLKKAKERVEESDRVKSEFLHLISHELRTPLNGILGFSELIDKSATPDQIKTYNNFIRQSGVRLFRMIDDILTLTNIQGKKTVIKMEEFELLPELEKLHYKFEYESSKLKRNIHFQLKFNFQTDFRIVSDKEKLLFILTRLLDNAISFSEGGTISFGAKIKKHNITFYVKDNGVGISKEHRESVFLDFKKIHSPDRPFHTGLGNSLYISKELVELLGGTIWFDSEVNKGSTFYFSLPLYENNVGKSIPE